MAPTAPDPGGAAAACRLCGTLAAPEDLPLGWSVETGRDGVDEVLCPQCARRHVRDIECRLDP